MSVSEAEQKTEPKIPSDNPIECSGEDRLERKGVAEDFAQHVLKLDASEGAVVGVFGPWGSGKTSFLNLAKETWKGKVPVIDFNPWLFSGTEQLVRRFFDEISSQSKSLGFRISKALAKYEGELTSVSNIPRRLRTIGDVSSFAGVGSLATGVGSLTIEFVPNFPDVLSSTIKGALFLVGLLLVITGKFLKHCQWNIDSRRKKVTKVLKKRDNLEKRKFLKKSNKRIVIVLDDVDRLEKSEIRSIFKLVRLTANFPNIVYIIACDRLRVEQALEEKGLGGRDYLEKIIQLPFDLPQAPGHILDQQLRNEIEKAYAEIEKTGPFDEQVWLDVYREIIWPLIRNMRDVRRYTGAIRETIAGLEGKVALADVLGLEAVRMFLPDAFNRLPVLMDILTARSQLSSTESESMSPEAASRKYSNEPENIKIDARRIGELIEAGKAPEVVESMLYLLFPACGQNIFGTNTHPQFLGKDDQDVEKIRKLFPPMDIPLPEKYLVDCRVAHEAILQFYLERVPGEHLVIFDEARRAFDLMADREALDEFMQEIKSEQRCVDVIQYLRGFVDQFREEHVEPGSIVLLNLLPDMPGEPLHTTRLTVRGIIVRLFRVLENVTAVEAAVRRILPAVTTLSSKVELVLDIGYREDVDSNLVSETAAAEFGKGLLDRIRNTPVDDLAEDPNLELILDFANTVADPSSDPFDNKKSAQLTFAILGRVLSGATNVDSLDHVQDLKRRHLIDLYGSEEVLKARLENLRTQFETLKPWIAETQKMTPDAAEKLLDLADAFLSRTEPD